MNYEETEAMIAEAWNAQADHLNQWDSLGEDEKREFTEQYQKWHPNKDMLMNDETEARIANIEHYMATYGREHVTSAEISWLIFELRKAREQLRIARDGLTRMREDPFLENTSDYKNKAEDTLKQMEAANAKD